MPAGSCGGGERSKGSKADSLPRRDVGGRGSAAKPPLLCWLWGRERALFELGLVGHPQGRALAEDLSDHSVCALPMGLGTSQNACAPQQLLGWIVLGEATGPGHPTPVAHTSPSQTAGGVNSEQAPITTRAMVGTEAILSLWSLLPKPQTPGTESVGCILAGPPAKLVFLPARNCCAQKGRPAPLEDRRAGCRDSKCSPPQPGSAESVWRVGGVGGYRTSTCTAQRLNSDPPPHSKWVGEATDEGLQGAQGGAATLPLPRQHRWQRLLPSSPHGFRCKPPAAKVLSPPQAPSGHLETPPHCPPPPSAITLPLQGATLSFRARPCPEAAKWVAHLPQGGRALEMDPRCRKSTSFSPPPTTTAWADMASLWALAPPPPCLRAKAGARPPVPRGEGSASAHRPLQGGSGDPGSQLPPPPSSGSAS